MPESGVAIAGATVSLGQTVTAYTFFLPPLSAVRKAGDEDADMRGDVRLGQVAAGVLSLAVGAMLSNLTGSPVPLYVSLAASAVIAVLYEIALRGERIME